MLCLRFFTVDDNLKWGLAASVDKRWLVSVCQYADMNLNLPEREELGGLNFCHVCYFEGAALAAKH